MEISEDRKNLKKEISKFLFEYDFSESSYHQRALAYIKNTLELLDIKENVQLPTRTLTTINGNKVLVYGIVIVNDGVILVNGKVKLKDNVEYVLIRMDDFDCDSVIKMLRAVSRLLKKTTTTSDYGDNVLLEDIEEME